MSDTGEDASERNVEFQSPLATSECTLTPKLGDIQPLRKRSISDSCIAEFEEDYGEEQDTLKAINGIEHSERLQRALDDSQRTMQSLIDSLNEFQTASATNRPSEEDDVISEEQDAEMLAAYQDDGVVRRRSRTTLSASLAERHKVASTISLSEPDLTAIGVNPRSPPPMRPRTSGSPAHRRGSGFASGISSSESSPFHHGSAMTSVPASHKYLSITRSTPGEDKFATSLQLPKSPSATLERKIGRFVKRKGRKSETLPSRHSPLPPLGKSSSMFFPADTPKSKGIFKGLKSRFAKRQSNVNFDEPDCPQKPSRSPGPTKSPGPTVRRSRTFMRNNSISSDSPIGLGAPLPSVDEAGRSPVSRRRNNVSSSQGSALPLITKIFSVLNVWQEHHFEVGWEGDV